jgi:hypothetical protein
MKCLSIYVNSHWLLLSELQKFLPQLSKKEFNWILKVNLHWHCQVEKYTIALSPADRKTCPKNPRSQYIREWETNSKGSNCNKHQWPSLLNLKYVSSSVKLNQTHSFFNKIKFMFQNLYLVKLVQGAWDGNWYILTHPSCSIDMLKINMTSGSPLILVLAKQYESRCCKHQCPSLQLLIQYDDWFLNHLWNWSMYQNLS